MVLFSTWPSGSMPVIFGGGITLDKAGFDERGLAWKSRFSIQRRYHFGSTLFGSYLLESSAIAMNHPRQVADCNWVGTPCCGVRTGAARRPTTTALRRTLGNIKVPAA